MFFSSSSYKTSKSIFTPSESEYNKNEVSKSFMARSSDSKYAEELRKKAEQKAEEVYDKMNEKTYEIIRSKSVGIFLIIKLKYKNTDNYEGKKILVFESVDIEKLINMKHIDPHFLEGTEIPHPIARFVPTHKGWQMALAFCNAMK